MGLGWQLQSLEDVVFKLLFLQANSLELQLCYQEFYYPQQKEIYYNGGCYSYRKMPESIYSCGRRIEHVTLLGKNLYSEYIEAGVLST